MDIIASLSITCVGTKNVHVDSIIPSVIYGPSIRYRHELNIKVHQHTD